MTDSPQDTNKAPNETPAPAEPSRVDAALAALDQVIKDVEALWKAVFGENTRPVTPEPSEED